MKQIFVLVIFFLMACTDNLSTSSNDERDGRVFGWRNDNFNPVKDNNDVMGYGNLQRIYLVGDRIILVDNHYSENEYTSPGYVTRTPRVFASRIGISQWDTLYSSEWIRYVYGIATYKGFPVVCFAGYDDQNDLRQETIKIFFKMQVDSGWIDITYDYDSSTEYPFQFHKGLEHNGKLYAISGARGMWSFDGNSWIQHA